MGGSALPIFCHCFSWKQDNINSFENIIHLYDRALTFSRDQNRDRDIREKPTNETKWINVPSGSQRRRGVQLQKNITPIFNKYDILGN